MQNKKKAMLLIMDGWGLGQIPASDAIYHAATPFIDGAISHNPFTTLDACGPPVGLPPGQMGNSEVGHLNLGAGRIVYQEIQRINVAVEDGTLATNATWLQALDYAKQKHNRLHFIGLVSDGGVHSHTAHLRALCNYATAAGLSEFFVHAFTDGRDTDPKSGTGYIAGLQQHLADTPGKLASITGRYYAMDRDTRWERIKLAYDALVHGTGLRTTDPLAALEQSYEQGITDEFVTPIIAVDDNGEPVATIQAGDVVLCFNFRTDRCREITRVLTQEAFPTLEMKPLNLHYYTMTMYDTTFKNVDVLFHNHNLTHTLGEVLEANNYRQIRIAETEKYPHVTFFFSGGRQTAFKGEARIICPSPKDVATYDLKPEMSARELTAAIIAEIEQDSTDFICLNFANTDMVGHTGVWSAAVEAAETVDDCVSQIVPVALEHGFGIFLTADHGNSDYLINEDGSPNTQHSLNKVPLAIISKDFRGKLKEGGKLGDIAPSILSYLGLKIPAEMTGTVLFES